MISLARKYRPKRFADLLVQEHVAAALRGAVANSRIGHGYLLTGPRGVGKTTAARILAMALNCERRDPAEPTGEPCGDCPSCQRIWSGSANLDVVEIDAASNRSVDDARDLRERAMYAASQENGYKVYIVDEAHMLTREAWNALLKILEEPPPRVVFVFATTEPQKIANTASPVLSRLQRFDFHRIGLGAIRDRLRHVLAAEGLEADEGALALIARSADGGMRDALSVLDQCLGLGEGRLTAERVRRTLGLIDDEVYAEVLRIVANRATGKVFPVVESLVAAGADLVEFMNGLAEVLRALLMLETGATPEGLTTAIREAIDESQDRLAPADVLRMLNLLSQAEASIRRSASSRLVVETLILRWTLMDRLVDLEEIVATGGREEAGKADRADKAGRAVNPRGPASAASPASTASPAPSRSASSAPAAPLSTALFPSWPAIIERARETRPLLAQILETATPVGLEGDVLLLQGEDPHMLEGLQRQLPSVEAVVRDVTGTPLRVRAVSAQSVAVRDQPSPQLLSQDRLRADRLHRLRAQDPALDTAAEGLDLEILDG